jgi:hypothetical protein
MQPFSKRQHRYGASQNQPNPTKGVKILDLGFNVENLDQGERLQFLNNRRLKALHPCDDRG